jgi:hypothetical protein
LGRGDFRPPRPSQGRRGQTYGRRRWIVRRGLSPYATTVRVKAWVTTTLVFPFPNVAVKVTW